MVPENLFWPEKKIYTHKEENIYKIHEMRNK